MVGDAPWGGPAAEASSAVQLVPVPEPEPAGTSRETAKAMTGSSGTAGLPPPGTPAA